MPLATTHGRRSSFGSQKRPRTREGALCWSRAREADSPSGLFYDNTKNNNNNDNSRNNRSSSTATIKINTALAMITILMTTRATIRMQVSQNLFLNSLEMNFNILLKMASEGYSESVRPCTFWGVCRAWHSYRLRVQLPHIGPTLVQHSLQDCSSFLACFNMRKFKQPTLHNMCMSRKARRDRQRRIDAGDAPRTDSSTFPAMLPRSGEVRFSQLFREFCDVVTFLEEYQVQLK